VQDISPREAYARIQEPPPGTFVPMNLGDPPRSVRMKHRVRNRLFSEFSESDMTSPRQNQQRSFALHKKSKSKGWGQHDCQNAFDACKLGRLPELKALIKKGVPVTCTPYGNESLAYMASYYGHLSCLKYLFDSGADMMSLGRNGKNVGHAAAFQGKLDILRWLHEKGFKILSVKTSKNETCLQIATNQGHVDCVRFLQGLTGPKPIRKKENIDWLLNRIDHLDEEMLEDVLARVLKNLRQKRNERSRQNECVVCMSAKREYAFECGHLCCCESCVKQIKSSTKVCPICRKRVHKHFRVYT